MDQILIDYQGQKLSIKKIAELNGLNFRVLTNKYKKTGDINEAVENLKVTQRGPVKYLDFFGQKMTINQIAKMYDIRRDTLACIYERTADIDEAVSICINDENTGLKSQEKKLKFQKNTISIDKVKNLANDSFPETSLKSNDHTLLNNSIDPIKMAENNILTEELNKVMQKTLKTREEKVLRLRFGIDGGDHAIKNIAAKIGVKPELIKQIEASALIKLRNPKNNKYLIDFARDM